MRMNLSMLALMVEFAVKDEPPPGLREYCGAYYSPYYNLLYMLAQTLGPHEVAVELGVETGRGSMAMLLADARVIGVDHTRRPEVDDLRRSFPKYTFLEQPSLPVPPPVLDFDKRVSILHIDTEHSYAQAREEFNAYFPFLHNPAVVCFDDTHAMADDVGRFVCGLKWPLIFDERLHSCGYAVMLYDGER